MNSSATAEWALFGFGLLTAAVAGIVYKYVPRLFKGKSIQEVVDGANSVIALYDNHVKALMLKVESLESEVASLTAKLDETLKANGVLQRMLAASPPINLPEVPGEPVQK